MSDDLAFETAIKTAPERLVPRLAYADYCEERGDTAFAEVLRDPKLGFNIARLAAYSGSSLRDAWDQLLEAKAWVERMDREDAEREAQREHARLTTPWAIPESE